MTKLFQLVDSDDNSPIALISVIYDYPQVNTEKMVTITVEQATETVWNDLIEEDGDMNNFPDMVCAEIEMLKQQYRAERVFVENILV